MSYKEWCEIHFKKHSAIMKKLSHLSDDEVIEYFDYEHMRVAEPDFCLLYADGKKCHEMENLNCYLCACPHFRFDDDGIKKVGEKTLFSFCSIDAKKGKVFESESAMHQDCTHCFIPHKKEFIKKLFHRDLQSIIESKS